MIDKDMEKLKHRVKIGRFREFEDTDGTLKSDFNAYKEVWAEIKPLPLTTQSLPLEAGEHHIKHTKSIYFVKIRENVISRARHETINAIVWKYKILTNFYSLRQDASGNFLEGLFYDQGRGIVND